ncbi:MAG: GTPase Era [Oscillospiraceae bacterium]
MEVKKSGIITIVGRPNVGKSTLLNALVGEKIAIVTNKPQTTRNRICGIVTRGDCQFVFTDTPGLHKARNRLGEYMDGVVRASITDVDAAVLVVEPIPKPGAPELQLMERMKALKVPGVLVINKIDTLEQKDKLLEVIDAYQQEFDFDAVLPLSAQKGDGVPELMDTLTGYLTEGPQLFPEDMTTDQPERQVMAEILREKMLRLLQREIPHGTAVEITRFSERDNGIVDVEATIYCEKASHKGIIIGKQGAMLKKISTSARKDMERFMGTKVFLTTWVKVKENWRDNLAAIHNFGYSDQ